MHGIGRLLQWSESCCGCGDGLGVTCQSPVSPPGRVKFVLIPRFFRGSWAFRKSQGVKETRKLGMCRKEQRIWRGNCRPLSRMADDEGRGIIYLCCGWKLSRSGGFYGRYWPLSRAWSTSRLAGVCSLDFVLCRGRHETQNHLKTPK